jgi:hypothetical protein
MGIGFSVFSRVLNWQYLYIEEMMYLFKERASSSKLGIGKKMWPRKGGRKKGRERGKLA